MTEPTKEQPSVPDVIYIVTKAPGPAGEDGCRLEVGDRVTEIHAAMHPECGFVKEAN